MPTCRGYTDGPVRKIGARRRSGTTSGPAAKQPVAVEGEHPNWRGHAWRLLAIWGLLLTAYSNSFQAGLVFDNSTVIGQDPRIRQATLHNVASILTRPYRPDWHAFPVDCRRRLRSSNRPSVANPISSKRTSI
jgi:hypothetical protein